MLSWAGGIQRTLNMKATCILRWLVMLSVPLLSYCAVVPTSEQVNYKGCYVKTPKWRLEYSQVTAVETCRGSGGSMAFACLATVGIIIPAVSTVVSGSIVLIGNTVHWIEYQGNCDEEAIKATLQRQVQELGSNN